jgi:hypothetical protein
LLIPLKKGTLWKVAKETINIENEELLVVLDQGQKV